MIPDLGKQKSPWQGLLQQAVVTQEGETGCLGLKSQGHGWPCPPRADLCSFRTVPPNLSLGQEHRAGDPLPNARAQELGDCMSSSPSHLDNSPSLHWPEGQLGLCRPWLPFWCAGSLLSTSVGCSLFPASLHHTCSARHVWYVYHASSTYNFTDVVKDS